MKIELKNYNDIKAVACLKNIKLETELPKALGYKSRWGLKMALKNPRKKDKILKEAEIFFSKL